MASYQRRAFIRIIGSSTVVLAAAAAGYTLTREPTEALRPWRQAGSAYDDPRLTALSYAILAPNPHNRQPWQVQLLGADSLLLFCDPERLLPETDPFGRQILIGLGCFLELLRMAALAEGYQLKITPFPDGEYGPNAMPDQRPVAAIQFLPAPSTTRDPLFEQVLARRTNKEPYALARPVADAELAALIAPQIISDDGDGAVIAQAVNTESEIAALRALCWQAHRVEALTPRTYLESVQLMRIGKAEIEASPDGIDIGGVFPETLHHLGLLTRETISDTDSEAFRQGMDMYHEIIHSAMGWVWLSTPGNRRTDQLNAGRAWVRIHLQATALGLDIHPLSQALQEYSEMSELYQQLRQQLDITPSQQLQMLGRIGYGPAIAESPRWPASTRLLAT